MDNRPIGVCDSGLGGMVVLSEIVNLLPKENFIYLGDTGRFPYGTKSKENIKKYTKESIEFLISKNVKAIVVACGTASTVLPEVLKENFYNVPVIGVLEPTLKSIEKNDTKLGIIATPRTITSKAWNKILNNVCLDREIIDNACPILAPLAEAGWTNNEIAKLTIKEYLKPFKDNNISELILGCTHYPLFKNLINEELKNVKLIDIGEQTAIYLKKFMEDENILNESNIKSPIEINLTDMDDNYLNMINHLLEDMLKIKTEDVKKIEL